MSAEEEKPEQEERDEETNDLLEPMWAVVAFDGPIAAALTYDEARSVIAKHSEEERPGLCLVTDAVAERMRRG